MEHYNWMRHFADSWGLLAMLVFFIAAVAILFRPGARAMHDNAASIPLRDDTPDRDVTETKAAKSENFSLKSEGAK